jgi:hypothetical protein
MRPKKERKEYPVLAVRLSSEAMEHVRRIAQMHRMTIAQYVRYTLIPLETTVRKIIVDKL